MHDCVFVSVFACVHVPLGKPPLCIMRWQIINPITYPYHKCLAVNTFVVCTIRLRLGTIYYPWTNLGNNPFSPGSCPPWLRRQLSSGTCNNITKIVLCFNRQPITTKYSCVTKKCLAVTSMRYLPLCNTGNTQTSKNIII